MQEKNIENESLRNFSKNIRELRLKSNETQLSISMKLKLDYRGYQKMESKNPPDIKFSTIIKFLKFYNIKFEDLIK
ncbi:MAG: hypothetical protein A2086_01680 [Spirochaetes bacterium GWD1_27_9]|nr:MAG: hypothetical protein A2Z98_04050 [Spirochaetes bacterium GWB1_27_13]OHD20620.1 MAG: hypothetical protein A2Y34_17530 [Spirochaetes bacterium GWC1_27_15]OHD41813.1 MAG: hypothetical protein A2086_01680 [Spirochaetes bacterium GWD1_27_9]